MAVLVLLEKLPNS